jgi:hypothetical protein
MKKKKDNPKTFVEKFIGSEVRDELDLEYPYNKGDVMTPVSRLDFAEVQSIDINEVIKICNDLKNKGANRLYIATHSDHQGYYFHGVCLKEI